MTPDKKSNPSQQQAQNDPRKPGSSQSQSSQQNLGQDREQQAGASQRGNNPSMDDTSPNSGQRQRDPSAQQNPGQKAPGVSEEDEEEEEEEEEEGEENIEKSSNVGSNDRSNDQSRP